MFYHREANINKKSFLIALFVLFFFYNVIQIYAFIEKGDTLIIEQTDITAIQSLDDIIGADTLESGERIHAVYELVENCTYELKATLNCTGYHLNLVGPQVRTDNDARRPLILYSNGFNGWFGLEGGDITLKHIHWEQIENVEGGNITPWARAGINIKDSSKIVILNDMIWDFNSGFMLTVNKNNLKLKVTNCLFRFNKDLTNGLWRGMGFDLQGATLDTILFRDCTWYGGGTFFVNAYQSTSKLFCMDHCTVTDFVQFPIHGRHWKNACFTNNLFYNAHTMGQDFEMRHTSEPDTLPYGIINIDTIYIDSLAQVDTALEAARNMRISNNNNYVSPNIKSYWFESMGDPDYDVFLVADPTFYDGFMNSRTQSMFKDDINYPHLILENTNSLDPQFTDYFDYSDTLIHYSKYVFSYANPDAVPTTFMRDPDGDPLNPTDPMIYNLKINNPTLLISATDGGVVGDRTWELSYGYNSTNINKTITGFEQDVRDEKLNMTRFTLVQNYPNPFNPSTTIKFNIPFTMKVKLDVYNVLGKHVDTIVDSYLPAGLHETKWPLTKDQYPSGIYFYKIQASKFTKVNQMLLLK